MGNIIKIIITLKEWIVTADSRWMLSRRALFAILLLVVFVLDIDGRPFFTLALPACAVNIFYPFRNKWKTAILIFIYLIAVLFIMSWMFFRGNIYYDLFAAAFLLVAYIWRRDAALGLTLFIVIFLYLQSMGTAYAQLPLIVILISSIVIADAGVYLARSVLANAFPEDPLIMAVYFSFMMMIGFFFLPTPYPTGVIESQSGVKVLAGCDTDIYFRDSLIFNQLNFVDQYDESSLMIGTKHVMTIAGDSSRNLLVNIQNNRLEYIEHPLVYISHSLIRCGDGEFFDITGYPEISETTLGYCMGGGRFLLTGEDLNIYLIDLNAGKVVAHEQATNALSHEAKIRNVAVFGDEEILRLKGRGVYSGKLNIQNNRIDWMEKGDNPYTLIMNDMITGVSGYPYLFIIRQIGVIRKVDPEGMRSLACAWVLPGPRFLTVDTGLGCIFMVNEWLGIVYTMNIENLEIIDRLFVGHGARQVNMSDNERGVGYIISRAGIVEIDFCARLPNLCMDSEQKSQGMR